MKTRMIVLLLSLACPATIFAQYDYDTDALEAKLGDPSLSPAERLTVYDELGWAYNVSDSQKSIFYTNEGLRLAAELGDENTEGLLYVQLGTVYDMIGSTDSAGIFYHKALALGDKLNDSKLLYMANNALGNHYSDLAQLDLALEHYLTNLRAARLAGDEHEECYSLAGIGILYLSQDNYAKAEQYFLEAMPLAERLDYTNALATIFVNLDEVYVRQGMPEKGLDYSLRAAGLYHEIGYYPEEISALLGVARSYLTLKDHDNALLHASRALEEAVEIGYPRQIALAHRMFSFIYYAMERPVQARQHALDAYAHADSLDYHNLELLEHLVKIHIDLGDATAAKDWFDTHLRLATQYNTSEMSRSLSEMEVKYETEKKETRIAALEGEKRLIMWLSIAVGGVLVLGLAVVFFLWRLTVRRRRQLEQEKQLVATQAVLDGEVQERARLARDLHDGLGSMLTGTKMGFVEMKQNAELAPVDVERFDRALNLLDESMCEMRRVAHHLMPDSLSRFGLKPAVGDFCSNLPSVEFVYYGDESRLESNLEVMIYRCIYELVNNALKHARASQILVQIMQRPDGIAFTVQDDGVGFDPAATETEGSKGIGLANIRTRVASHGGVLNIDSRAGEGTEINIEIRL